LKIIDKFDGTSNLEYDKDGLKFFKAKTITTSTPKSDETLKCFLKDLQALIQKYV
jgi:hypothetical protein